MADIQLHWCSSFKTSCPRGALIAAEPEMGGEEVFELAGTLAIQNEIWHDLTWAALRLAPKELLPDHIHDVYSDLGI